MKIVIVCNNKIGDWYQAYKYTFWFRLFGPEYCSSIGLGSPSEDALIKSVTKYIHSKLEIVRIVEV